MSTEQPQSSTATTSSKPITAAFDLQTKIRVIIQQVLAATMRKISQFNQKVEVFQKFFFTYTQRINDMQDKCRMNQQSFTRLFDSVVKNKQGSETQFIKLEQKNEKLKIQKQQLNEEVRQIQKKINTINRQNQNINNEFSNTKKVFIDYSNQMTALKQQVAWKITKYVEQTAEINTKIQISNQQIKKQYFNVNLALQKNKQKYQQIISNRDKQDSLNEKFQQQLDSLSTVVKQKTQTINLLNKKLEQMDTALYAKIKLTQSKLERKIDELSQNNLKIQKSVSKVDGFSKLLEQIRQDSQKIRRQLMKKFEESDQKNNDRIQKQVLALNMSILNYEKATDKKFRTIGQTQQKNVQFFNQKMQYLKIQIETQISSKATKMLEQKSKTQSGVATSALQQVQQRINKLTLETKKQINKIQNILKEVKNQVKHNLEDMKESVETRITTTIRAIQESQGSGVSPQFVQTINQKIQKVKDIANMKLSQFGREISEQSLRIKTVQTMKAQTQAKFPQLIQQSSNKFAELEQKISAKVERVLYTVTKLRGDAIIRNQFTDKQIKELKKVSQSSARQVSTILKLFPAIGECINLVMCLIFDAEFQHAKVIQDNLPSPTKNSALKFQNLVQGVLYEYMEKKKPGYIIYRHKQQKKMDIVKATFNGYIQIWEELFDNDFKGKSEFIPKTFYKKYVQKNMGLSSRNSNSPNKQMSHPANLQNINNRQMGSKQMIGGITSQDSRNNLRVNQSNSSEKMNRSFHIRKKKISTIKSKDDLIMVVQQNIKEEK